MDGTLVYVNGSNVVVDRCLVSFTDTDTLATHAQDLAIELGPNADGYVSITNNRIDKAFSGIVSDYGCECLEICENELVEIMDGGAPGSDAIRVGTSAAAVTKTTISGNTVIFPSVGSGTIRGIYVDVDNDISVMRINNNNIIHTHGNSVTDGIRIDKSAASSGHVSDLFLSGNLVDGIGLDGGGSTYGIYVGYTKRIHIDGNTIRNVDNSADGEYIGILGTSSTTSVRVDGNILETGDAAYGIYCNTSNPDYVEITNNIMSGLGSTAAYIRGSSSKTIIDGNIIVGPGNYGINWIGANSTINNNNINGSFVNYAVVVGTDSLFCGNTVIGTSLPHVVSVWGSGSSFYNNYIKNTTDNTTEAFSVGSGYSDLSFANNTIVGDFTTIFYSGSTITNAVLLNNNALNTTIATNAINFANTTTSVIDGNVFPVDTAHTLGAITNSLVDKNRGLLDTRGLSLGNAVSSHSGASFTDPDWYISGAVDTGLVKFLANKNHSPDESRKLLFPISGLPNGSRIVSANVHGDNSASGVDIVMDMYRVTIDGVGTAESIATGAETVFNLTSTFNGTTSPNGLVTADAVKNTIDYSTYTYFLVVEIDTSAISTEPYITGATINIRY